jgi:hypothetical protein
MAYIAHMDQFPASGDAEGELAIASNHLHNLDSSLRPTLSNEAVSFKAPLINRD